MPTPPGTRLARLRLPLETPRLVLRLPDRRDVPDLARSFRDPRTARAVGAPLHSVEERRHPELMVARTRAEYRRGEHLSLSVLVRDGGACIGRVGLRGLDWRWRKVESLSYWIDPRCWNRGLATEAAGRLCTAAFGSLRMRRIASQALEPNVASRHVLDRLGFVEEGRERAAVRWRGRSMDMILYGLFPEELRPPEVERPGGRGGATVLRSARGPAPRGRGPAPAGPP